MSNKIKLGTNMDLVADDKFYAWLNLVDKDGFGEVEQCIPMGYLTLSECVKAREAIATLNMLRGTP